jgi:hypothetical protein
MSTPSLVERLSQLDSLAYSGLLPWAAGKMKKLLFIVISIVAIGLSCGRDSSANTIDAAAFTGACRKLPSPSAPNFTNRFNEFVTQLCYQKQQWEHDANRRSSQNIHDTLVKIWYSPLLFKWMFTRHVYDAPGRRDG